MANISSKVTILTQQEAQQIHEASVRLLSRVGMKIEHERMLQLLGGIGAEIDTAHMIAKFPLPLLERCLQAQVAKANTRKQKQVSNLNADEQAPARVQLSTHMFCVSVNDGGNIREARLDDLNRSIILANELENVAVIGPLVVPGDVPLTANDAYMWASQIKYAKKKITGEILNLGSVPFIHEMCCLAAGGSDALKANPIAIFACFPSSPFCYSRYALDIAFCVIDLGMPVRFGASMVVAGFTGPVTLAGTLTVANAEALASMVMAEAVGGDSFGILGVNINYDQTNGVALYASPEKTLMTFAAREIAKFYGYIDWRNFCGHTNSSDACLIGHQSGIEKGATSMLQLLAGGGISHCGMVSPEAASLVQMVIDNEICSYINRFGEGIRVNGDTISEALISELGIHGNYMDTENERALDHLAEHFRRENFIPSLFVRDRPDTWQHSRRDMAELAEKRMDNILRDYENRLPRDEKTKEIDRILSACVQAVNK